MDVNFKLREVATKGYSVMETRNHSKKNGVSPKDQMSRGNNLMSVKGAVVKYNLK